MKFSFIIIDDRELDCFIAEKLIQRTGFSTDNKIFYDGNTALNFIRNNVAEQMSIILLDIMMPVMDGFQFIEEFESLPKEIQKNYRIIAITTSLNKNDIHKISSFETVKGVLRKPFTLDALVKTVEGLPSA